MLILVYLTSLSKIVKHLYSTADSSFACPGLRASGLARRLDQATKIHFQLKFSEHFQATQSPLELNQNSKNSKAVLFLSNLNQKLKTLLSP
jgi:hypothetical protein